jgi:hypothetical protein
VSRSLRTDPDDRLLAALPEPERRIGLELIRELDAHLIDDDGIAQRWELWEAQGDRRHVTPRVIS